MWDTKRSRANPDKNESQNDDRSPAALCNYFHSALKILIDIQFTVMFMSTVDYWAAFPK